MSSAILKDSVTISNAHFRQCDQSRSYQSLNVSRPYTTIRCRIDRFLSELATILPICSQMEQERLWFTLQEIFTIYQPIYTVSPQLPKFLIKNRQKQNLRRIAMVVAHLPPTYPSTITHPS